MLTLTSHNDVKAYCVTAGKTLPEWLSEAQKKKKSLRYNMDFRSRIELIQDLDFPSAASRIKVSPNGEFLMATGVYPPMLKMYELSELTMKFQRNVDNEIQDFLFLSEDWKKLVLLGDNRTIDFHSQAGPHHRTRIPKFGRGLAYNEFTCELFVVSASNEVFRLDLDEGRFREAYASNSPSNNVARVSCLQLLAVGGESGTIECWDSRVQTPVGVLDVAASVSLPRLGSKRPEVSEVQFRDDGLMIAAGTSSGHCLLYDLRSSRPVVIKDHQYEFPINTIAFHESGYMASADKKVVKFWDKNTGDTYTSVEPAHNINSMECVPKSGLVFLAAEHPRIQAYFLPSLGQAPAWCSFLDSLTEEMEEVKETAVYDDYKFVTKDELESLGVAHLIGTNLLKADMHGFFMDLRLYNKIKDASDPFAYERWRKEEIKRKIEAARGQRITIKKRLPKVNTEYAEKLLKSQKSSRKGKGPVTEGEGDDDDGDRHQDLDGVAAARKSVMSTEGVDVSNPLGDDRFKDMFNDPNFAIDPNDDNYAHLLPARRFANKRDDSDEELLNFEKIGGSDPETSDSDLDFLGGHKSSADERESSNDIDDKGENDRGKKRKKKGPTMYEAQRGLDDLDEPNAKRRRRAVLPFARLVAESDHAPKHRVGNIETTFTIKKKNKPMSERQKAELEHKHDAHTRKRRGVRDLRLKKIDEGGWYKGQRVGPSPSYSSKK